MPTLIDLARLSNAVYGPNLLGTKMGRWSCILSSESAGFQAATYTNGDETVVAFRGTQGRSDVAADLTLGAGMNTSYFALAEAYCSHYDVKNVFICGHSLGGAIAQVVANRMGFCFATFNAPGVGIFASKELYKTSIFMMSVRMLGGTIDALRSPRKAYRDAKLMFEPVYGVNVVLRWDPFSSIGLHYGEVRLISNNNVLKAHSCETVISALSGAEGRFDIATLRPMV